MAKIAATQTSEVTLDFGKLLGFSRLTACAGHPASTPSGTRCNEAGSQVDDVANALAAVCNKIGIGEVPPG
jgi:hypothetical protein